MKYLMFIFLLFFCLGSVFANPLRSVRSVNKSLSESRITIPPEQIPHRDPRWGEYEPRAIEVDGSEELHFSIPVLDLEDVMGWSADHEISPEPEEIEEPWITWDPPDGQIEPGQDIETIVNLLAENLPGGGV